MLKGVNKQILEVTNPDSPYFEKIIFFVKPTDKSVDEKKLKIEAIQFSKTHQKPPRQRRTFRQIASSLIYAALGVGAGTAAAFVLNNIL